MKETRKICLLADPSYQRGFAVRGLGGDEGSTDVEYEEKFGQSQKPCWALAQWAAKYSLADPDCIHVKKPGVFEFCCPTNRLEVEPANKRLVFDCTTTNNYLHHRTGSEPWQHLLIETNFTDVHHPDDFTHLRDLKELNISGSVQLQRFEDHMGNAFDPDVHAAQFLLYLTVHNANPASCGFGEMIWFGVNFFDNRHIWSEYSAMFDVGTQCLMVGIGNRPAFPGGKSFFTPEGQIVAGLDTPEYAFSIAAQPYLHDAYYTARKEGYFTNTEYDDLYVTGMNLGWELPGTYNVAMQMRNFDVSVKV